MVPRRGQTTPEDRIDRLSDFKKSKLIDGVTEIIFRTVPTGEFYLLELQPDHRFRFEPAPDIYYRNLPIREVYSEPYRTIIYLEREVSLSISWPGEGDKLFVEAIEYEKG